jgi:hypothetical protein
VDLLLRTATDHPIILASLLVLTPSRLSLTKSTAKFWTVKLKSPPPESLVQHKTESSSRSRCIYDIAALLQVSGCQCALTPPLCIRMLVRIVYINSPLSENTVWTEFSTRGDVTTGSVCLRDSQGYIMLRRRSVDSDGSRTECARRLRHSL